MDKSKKGQIMANFKEIRKAQGVTQNQLAKHLGLVRQTVAVWEDEDKISLPTIKQAEEIADFLGFKLELILKTK